MAFLNLSALVKEQEEWEKEKALNTPKESEAPVILNESKAPKSSDLIPEIMRISWEILRKASQNLNDLRVKKSASILFDRVIMAIILNGVAGYFDRGKLPKEEGDLKRYCEAAIIREDVKFSALFDETKASVSDLMRRYNMGDYSELTDDKRVEIFYRTYLYSLITPLMRMIEDFLDQKFPDGIEVDYKLLRPDLYVKYDKSSPSKIAFTSMDDTLIEGKDENDKQTFLFLKTLKSLAREIVRNVGIVDEIKGASNAFHKAMEIGLGIRHSDSEWSTWERYFSGDMARGLYFCENKSLEGIINNLIALPKRKVREAVDAYKYQVLNSEICMRGALLLQEKYTFNTAPDYGSGVHLEGYRQMIEEQPKGYVDAMHELLCRLFFEGEERYAIEATDSLGSSKRTKDLIGEYHHTTTTFKLVLDRSSGGYNSPAEYIFNVEVTFHVAEFI